MKKSYNNHTNKFLQELYQSTLRKIDQKRIDTTLLSEDFDDDFNCSENYYRLEQLPSNFTDNSFQEGLSNSFAKENIACNYRSQQQNGKNLLHQRTMSANIPYATIGKHNRREKSRCENDNNVSQVLQNNKNIINANHQKQASSQYQNYYSDYHYVTTVQEVEEDEGENIQEEEGNECTLQEFYCDLEKPLMIKYSMSSIEIVNSPSVLDYHSCNTPQKTTAISRNENQQDHNININNEQECGPMQADSLQTDEQLDQNFFDDNSCLYKDCQPNNEMVDQLDSLEISLQCQEDEQNQERNSQPYLDPQAKFQLELLEKMLKQESEYKVDKNYFQRQPNISPQMRLILFDWMMEVCEEFMLKRDTFYMSIEYVDRYLSLADQEIPKSQLQLIGVTALFIATKVEEVTVPRLSDFALATDNGYTKDKIQRMEMKMVKALKWRLNPITIVHWANWYMQMWDLYSERALSNFDQKYDFSFKKPNETSYPRFRVLYQILDVLALSSHSYFYQSRVLLASAMYLIIGGPHMMGAFPYDYAEFPNIFNDLYIKYYQFNQQTEFFNKIFSCFLEECFGYFLLDIQPCIEYVAKFLALPFTYELPSAANNKNANTNNHYEEFLSFQTHNKNTVAFIKAMNL